MQFSTKSSASSPLLHIEPFKGIDLSVTSTQIDDHHSPDMMNIVIGTNGDAVKRFGFERSIPTSLGTSKITGMYLYRKINGNQYFLFSHDESLYVLNGNTPTLLFSGLYKGHNTSFFTTNDICYIMDGMNIKTFDGTNVGYPDQYIPTLTISNNPMGGGTLNEDWNLLGSGFKDSFSGNGTSTVYFLSLKGLDSDTVSAVVNGVTVYEGAGLTVDRINGKVTFNSPPSTGTNNVIITAYKTFFDKLFMIRKCQFNILYGGANDTRVFVGGNPDFPNRIWRSGLFDPTYFPENGFYNFPQTVKGFVKQYDTLLVELESSKHQVAFELNNGEPSFPSKPINDTIGTIASNSIQLIDNSPVSLDKSGVYMLVQSNVRDERNVQHLSKNVDAKLLKEPNLKDAVSVDFDKKYWLAVNGNVYVYDYLIQEWYLFNNINASYFLEKDGFLYFGSSTNGLIYRFKKETDTYPYNDDGSPIIAYWKSKTLSFGADEKRKIVEKVYFSLRPAIRTSADVYFQTDKKDRKHVKMTRKDLFNYAYFDYSKYSYSSNVFPQESNNKIKAKKIVYFQLEIRNEQMDEGMGLLSLAIQFNYQANVK